jgi:hypothetical protein
MKANDIPLRNPSLQYFALLQIQRKLPIRTPPGIVTFQRPQERQSIARKAPK